ncbi:hypothetical protein BV20DRAFT_118571 [Pilatotrama ljubarskyi]|nr:hypothetical protein BV20DRAFT_118571 [Pilatotrama ljubarskyi]
MSSGGNTEVRLLARDCVRLKKARRDSLSLSRPMTSTVLRSQQQQQQQQNSLELSSQVTSYSALARILRQSSQDSGTKEWSSPTIIPPSSSTDVIREPTSHFGTCYDRGPAPLLFDSLYHRKILSSWRCTTAASVSPFTENLPHARQTAVPSIMKG